MTFTEYLCERGHHAVQGPHDEPLMGKECGQCQIIGMGNKFVFENTFDNHDGVKEKEQIALDGGMFPVYSINTEQWTPMVV
jgi:hypothetical protein